MIPNALLEAFVAAFDVWEVARPYLPLIVDEPEMALIVRMEGRSVTAEQVAALLSMPTVEADAFLRRCYRRGVVNKKDEDGRVTYSPANFYTRLDIFAKFENWDDLPAEARRAIDRRYLDEFIARQRPKLARRMRGEAGGDSPSNDAVLLLAEVEAMIDAAADLVVLPCDCRRLAQNCNRPVDTCLWLDQSARDALDRGHGRRLTRDEAKELIRWADRKGLMHTGDAAWQENGLSPICNCCACDCYPFRAAQELGTKRMWPRARYVAVHNRTQCTLCGACVKRCHFAAFFHDGSTVEVEGKAKKNVVFDAAQCWGCGLCANACPNGAITMRSLSPASSP